MAQIKPFFAVRPSTSVVAKLAARPYDIVTLSEINDLINNNPYSLLRITRAECEFGDKINQYSNKVYEKAKSNYLQFLKHKWLIKDNNESLFIYKISDGIHKQIGITGLFSCNDYETGLIKKHEKTRIIKEKDRTKHISITGVQTGQVYLAHNQKHFCTEALTTSCSDENLIYDFHDDENIQHQLWRVPHKFTNHIIDKISQLDNIYIVDGHHRAAAALNNKCKYFIATLFPAHQLSTGCCNRVIKSIAPFTTEEFLSKISVNFYINQSNKNSVSELLLYIKDKWYKLSLKNNLDSKTLAKNSSYILQKEIFEKVLGIIDPRESDNINYIRSTKGKQILESEVDEKRATAAFSLNPPTVEEIIKIANEGDVMPPKSTWFWPKLKDGLLLYEI